MHAFFSDMLVVLFKRYEYSFFAGEGSAAVTTSKSDASVTLKFKSLNLGLLPPSDVEAT